MRPRTHHEAGVVLILVLTVLSLLGLVALTFSVYTSETQCEQNPTAEMRGETCIRIIGPDRR